MARTVADLALFLDSMIDFNARKGTQVGWGFPAPFNFPENVQCYADVVSHHVYPALLPKRIAWSADLNGLLAGVVEPETLQLCEEAAKWFATSAGGEADVSMGACPDLEKSRMVFGTLRGMSFAQDQSENLKHFRDLLKPEVIWNAEFAADAEISGRLEEAKAAHAELFKTVESFFDDYEMLITPTVIVQPYDINIRYPSSAGGFAFDNCKMDTLQP
eukprot:SAG31_NODE_4493_length_3188_cov_2.660084_5_plen_217_part_00